MQVIRRHARGDAELDEEVEGVAEFVDESLPVRLELGLLPGLELELLHGLGQLTREPAVELVEAVLDPTAVEVALEIPSDDRSAVELLDGVVLGHEVALTLEDHLEEVDRWQGLLSREGGGVGA